MPSLLTLPVGPATTSAAPSPRRSRWSNTATSSARSARRRIRSSRASLDTFGDRLRFVFRHFPLTNSHPHAQHAAEAAEVAARGGAFWPMYDALYAERAKLSDRTILECAAAAGVSSVECRARLGLARHARAASRKTSRAASRAASPARRRSSSTAPATKAAGTSSRSPTRSKRPCASGGSDPLAPRSGERVRDGAGALAIRLQRLEVQRLLHAVQDLLADLSLVAQLDDRLALGRQRLGAQALERGALRLRSGGTPDPRASARSAAPAAARRGGGRARAAAGG